MTHYIVVETDSGLSVAEVSDRKSADDVAVESGGVIVDPGPYKSYEAAKDAMLAVPDDEGERARLRE
ncbi:MAG: hypothetical protein DWQ31_15025 [Planctomycetota bacterium]|nr:MAG: hypothetical protein DWQ31_15025 [Planctomycetota bacterium]REJ96196.1 MAG: hypothetical protein DWQ35_05005 [Planctomycetota bacterium]REK29352.1 MAG: hypothetical protein DWQ42_03745 [Planctomycetota bacterium]REK44182.1 MAG: hypothetical protein DWQ46_10615 [Planctomycetota bacterium]